MGEESLTLDFILSGFLIFVRVGAVVMTAPFFNNKAFPMQVKLYFALVVTILLFYVIPDENTYTKASNNTIDFFWL
jgi:flagellar biosynthetic protein FliR